MARGVILVALSAMLLGMGQAQASPIEGHYREQYKDEMRFRPLEAGKTYDVFATFKGNQRACVIVEGDHKETGARLSVMVYDPKGNLVTADTGGGDCVAAMWYPPKAQRYRVAIQNSGANTTNLDIVVK